MTPTKTYHYFASSSFNWCVDEDLFRCIERVKRCDGKDWKGCNLYLVPLPIDAKYEINFYRPQVDGLIWVDSIQSTKGRPHDYTAKPDDLYFNENSPLQEK